MSRTHTTCVSRGVLAVLLWAIVGLLSVAYAQDPTGGASSPEIIGTILGAVIVQLAAQRYLPSRVDTSSTDRRLDDLSARVAALEEKGRRRERGDPDAT